MRQPLWVFRSRKRGNENLWSVSMVTYSVNLTYSLACFPWQTLHFYLSHTVGRHGVAKQLKLIPLWFERRWETEQRHTTILTLTMYNIIVLLYTVLQCVFKHMAVRWMLTTQKSPGPYGRKRVKVIFPREDVAIQPASTSTAPINPGDHILVKVWFPKFHIKATLPFL